VVVASGCTDGTEDIVREYVAIDPRVRPLTQARKEGKASAVNLLLRNTECEVVVLESADTLPLEDAIEALVSPMTDPRVGVVGGTTRPSAPTSTRGCGVRPSLKTRNGGDSSGGSPTTSASSAKKRKAGLS
jgi:cellulose synthase/poly-beta-1,6-N-acetylglucosamine synthase-like glycosyltransferase